MTIMDEYIKSLSETAMNAPNNNARPNIVKYVFGIILCTSSSFI